MKPILTKGILISVLFIGLFSSTFSQGKSKQDYLEKSRENRKTGFILLGGGVVMVVSGIAIALNNYAGNNDKTVDTVGGIMAITGAAAMLTSLHFFRVAETNNKKAAQLSIGNQPLNIPRYTGKIPKSYPAISLSIPLN